MVPLKESCVSLSMFYLFVFYSLYSHIAKYLFPFTFEVLFLPEVCLINSSLYKQTARHVTMASELTGAASQF